MRTLVLLARLLGRAPKPAAPHHLGYVPRGPAFRIERVLSAGTDSIGAHCIEVATLGPDEVERCFGIPRADA